MFCVRVLCGVEWKTDYKLWSGTFSLRIHKKIRLEEVKPLNVSILANWYNQLNADLFQTYSIIYFRYDMKQVYVDRF